MSYTTVAASLNAAKTRRDLLDAAENIQHVEGIQQREDLGGIVKRRLQEFKAAE